MKIEDCTPGLGVVYSPFGGHVEDGVVVRVNDQRTLVFVRYRDSEIPKATNPAHLEPLTRKGASQ